MRFVLTFLFLVCIASAQPGEPRYTFGEDGGLTFAGGLTLPRLNAGGEWRYFGSQERAGRELLRLSFVREGMREVTIDLSYSKKPSSGTFENSRLSGFLTGFSMKEGLSKGKEEKIELKLAGSKATRIVRALSDKGRVFYFVAYLIERMPHTTIWILTQDAEHARHYQTQIEKL
jgi:hypothetical protein